jgi:hypothetical protein
MRRWWARLAGTQNSIEEQELVCGIFQKSARCFILLSAKMQLCELQNPPTGQHQIVHQIDVNDETVAVVGTLEWWGLSRTHATVS